LTTFTQITISKKCRTYRSYAWSFFKVHLASTPKAQRTCREPV